MSFAIPLSKRFIATKTENRSFIMQDIIWRDFVLHQQALAVRSYKILVFASFLVVGAEDKDFQMSRPQPHHSQG